MVINMDKSKQGGIFSLFGDSSQGSYAKFWQDAQTLIARLQASRFIGGFLSPDQWFSWRFLVPILGSLALLWGCYKGLQILFPSFALWTWNKRRSRNPNKLSRIEFFERLTKLLQRVGLRRPHNQTPKEFLANAQTLLGRADVELDLDRFSSAFYSKRFGEERDLDPQETASIQNALKTLELAIQNGLRKKMKSLQHS